MRKERTERRGGGLIAAVHQSLNYTELQPIDSPVEHQIVEIFTPQSSFCIVNVYDTTTSLDVQFYRRVLSMRRTIVVGDFNAHHPLWGSAKACNKGKYLARIIEDLNATVHNDGSHTFFHPRGTSCLDLSITTPDISHLFQWENSWNFMSSDHAIISLSANSNTTGINHHAMTPTPSNAHNFKKADWASFSSNADSLLSQVNDECSIEAHFETTEAALMRSVQLSVPAYRPPTNPKHQRNPWWTDECKQAIRSRNKARNRFGHHKTEENYIAFKRAEAIVKRTIRQAKDKFWHSKSSSINRPNKKALGHDLDQALTR